MKYGTLDLGGKLKTFCVEISRKIVKLYTFEERDNFSSLRLFPPFRCTGRYFVSSPLTLVSSSNTVWSTLCSLRAGEKGPHIGRGSQGANYNKPG